MAGGRAQLKRRHSRQRPFRSIRNWDEKRTLSWSALRNGFDAIVASAATPDLFRDLRGKSPHLRRYRSVADLLAYLAKDLCAELDTKDAIYSELVRHAREGGPASSLAYALLCIGLWPGLSAAFARRLWFWQDRPDDLISEMTDAFTRLVARIDFNRVRRVVGTLVRSTERDVVRVSLLRAGEACRHRGRYDVEKLGPPERDSEQEDSRAVLWAERRRAVRGKESDPVVQALLQGKGPRYFAEALGLKPAAARQRLFRARKRLRAALVQARINA